MLKESALLATAAEGLFADREILITSMVQMTHDEIGALDHDAALRSLLEASITENVIAAINFLRQDIDVEHLDAPTSALAYARTLAQRDVPLSALIRAYRIGQSRFLDLGFAALYDLPTEERIIALLGMVRRSAAYIDQVCEQVGRAYELERDRWIASRSGIRQQLVNRLLIGGAVDIVDAERSLRYPMDAIHICCTLWAVAEVSSFDLISAVDEIRGQAVAVTNAHASLVVPTDEREVKLWLAIPSITEPGLDLLQPQIGTALHAALGRPGAGLAGFRRSALQAARVKEIVTTPLIQSQESSGRRSVKARWIRYDDVAPVALMAGEFDAVREFVMATLGDLAEPSARGAMLRLTLRTFLTHRRSYAAAAEEMNLHRNSVQYRIQQATALLPRAAASLDDDFNVRAALLAAHWFGTVPWSVP